jgi:ribosomal-protein-alanine N-acetyltransferase
MTDHAVIPRIRRMTPADLPQILEMARRLPTAPDWQATAYLDAMEPQRVPQRIALVAANSEGCTLAGFAVALLLPPQAELETIAVTPERQQSGVGRRLLAALVEQLLAEGASLLQLEARASNRPALALYRALGFVQTGHRPRYYDDPAEDALLLELRLA